MKILILLGPFSSFSEKSYGGVENLNIIQKVKLKMEFYSIVLEDTHHQKINFYV